MKPAPAVAEMIATNMIVGILLMRPLQVLPVRACRPAAFSIASQLPNLGVVRGITHRRRGPQLGIIGCSPRALLLPPESRVPWQFHQAVRWERPRQSLKRLAAAPAHDSAMFHPCSSETRRTD